MVVLARMANLFKARAAAVEGMAVQEVLAAGAQAEQADGFAVLLAERP